MTFREKVNSLLEKALEEKPSLFLIDLSINDALKILVTLDGDQGVNLQDCIDVSRAIEHNLDREEQDFALEVASCGATSPMKLPRQYAKNIGRTVKFIKTDGEIIEADIVAADQEKVSVTWSAREPKALGKGKQTVQKTLDLLYSDIKEATVIITY